MTKQEHVSKAVAHQPWTSLADWVETLGHLSELSDDQIETVARSGMVDIFALELLLQDGTEEPQDLVANRFDRIVEKNHFEIKALETSGVAT